MRKETKYISILASAIFSISLILLAIPSNIIGGSNYEDRWQEYSDSKYDNQAHMKGFGTTTTKIYFQYEDDKDEMDIDTFEFLKQSYNKFNYLDALGSTESSTLPVNNIYDINNAQVNEKVEINEELYSIINNSKELFEISNGIFDVTAGKMFEEVKDYIGGSSSYDTTQYATGFGTEFKDRITIEHIEDKYYATRTHEDTMLDLGGYLKGYFAEYVRGIATSYFPDNNRDIYVDSGSSSMTYIGESDKDILIASPRGDYNCGWFGVDGCPGKWEGQNNWHLSSSGDYVQYRIDESDNDLRVHHLVDPRDGTFVQDRGLVSIMSQDYASYLDALSSIIFIADPSEYSTILGALEEEIDVVYLTVNDTQDDYTVDYIQSTTEKKFTISDIHLPREVQ